MEVDEVSGSPLVGNPNQEANFEAALKQLRQDVLVLGVQIATAGNRPREEVDPLLLLLRQKKTDLQALEEVNSMMSSLSADSSVGNQNVSSSSSVVPSGLPLFQWVGSIRDEKKEVFADIEECLRRFEDVLSSHTLSFDKHWFRLLPRCLSNDLRDWLNEYVLASGSKVSWITLKAAITGRYGVPKEQLRFERIREFLSCNKLEGETVDGFLERFKTLKAKAEVTDRFVVAKVFFDAFPKSVSRLIMVAMSQASEASFYDLEYVSAVARRIDNAVDKKEFTSVGGKKRPVADGAVVVSSEAKKSKYAGSSGRSNSSRPGGQTVKFVSKFGKTMQEHMAERTCKKCNMHYVRGHTCGTAVRSAPDGSKVVRSMSKRQSVKAAVDAALLSARVDQAMANNKSVTVHASVPNTRGIKENSVVSSVDVTEDTIMTSHNGINDDSDLRDRAQATLVAEMSNVSVEDDIDIMQNMAAQECKFDAVFSAPPTMSTNSICVPIVVQDVICFGLVDTGATFSCITNEFFQFLGGSSLGTFKASDDDSVVQLAHEVTTVPREGTVDLNVSYNKYNKSHIFEVFSFYSEENVHVLLGMDILSKLGIGITGLVSRHGFQTGLRMPDPIDDSIEPNAHPFGTKKEREPFLLLLNKLLDQNSQIDMKNTQCNLPDSIIKLDTKPGCIAWRAQYPLPEAYRDAVGKQIQVWLDEGVITRSASHTRFNHPLLVVKKKDADGNYSMSKPRVVCDVRKLNAILEVDDKQQLPLISTIHQNIGTKMIHTCLDIHACFTSFGLDSRQAHKVSFTCPFSNVQYTHKKAAYGIRHVGAVVVRTLQTLLSDLNTPLSSPSSFPTDKCWSAVCYVDDIILSSNGSLADHFELVAEVIRRLTNANLVLNPEKVVFGQKSIHLLGWSVINGKLMPDGRKLTNIAQWPAIKTGRQLASFLGLMSYFRASIPCYSRLTQDLDTLKQYKDLAPVWKESHDKAVANLKNALTKALMLSPPDFSARFHLATDASLTAIGSILYQVINDEIRYVGLVSRKLSVSERNYSTTKRELLGICYSLVKFHRFLYMREFTLHTDHKSLIYLNTQEVPNALMLGWWETIFSYTFDIVHLPGVLNVIPDALSRLYEDDDADASARHLLGGRYYADGGESNKRKRKSSKLKVRTPPISMKRSVKIIKVTRNQSFDNKKRNVAVKSILVKDGTTSASVSKKQKELIVRTLKFADYMTPPLDERDNMIISHHLRGHYGIKHVELAIHKEGFHWKNIRKDIERILADCIECNKYNIAREGYHPFRSTKADMPLDHWCMDLGDMGVTSSYGSNYLFVLTDYFTRFTIIRCIPDKYATTIARELLQIFSLFGWPKCLTSDRGSEWVNDVVDTMMEISGIDKRLSLAYNPLGNATAESFIKLVKTTTVKLLNGKRDQWEHYVPWVNYCINTKYARLHKSRPYTLLFNRQPNGLEDYSKVEPTLSLEKADEKLINERYQFVQDVLIPAISKRIVETQEKDHAKFARKHKIITEHYPIGSKVMIKNVNRQNKLDERYEGPYLIHSITDKGSYVLADRTGALLSRDVPTHHISYKAAANPEPITVDEFSKQHFEIQAVIDHKGSPGNYLYLVRWKGFDDPSEDTWEPVENFNSTRHIELYWGRRKGARATGKRRSNPKTVNLRKPASRKKRGRQ
jgi:transposase InsO family protein